MESAAAEDKLTGKHDTGNSYLKYESEVNFERRLRRGPSALRRSRTAWYS